MFFVALNIGVEEVREAALSGLRRPRPDLVDDLNGDGGARLSTALSTLRRSAACGREVEPRHLHLRPRARPRERYRQCGDERRQHSLAKSKHMIRPRFKIMGRAAGIAARHSTMPAPRAFGARHFDAFTGWLGDRGCRPASITHPRPLLLSVTANSRRPARRTPRPTSLRPRVFNSASRSTTRPRPRATRRAPPRPRRAPARTRRRRVDEDGRADRAKPTELQREQHAPPGCAPWRPSRRAARAPQLAREGLLHSALPAAVHDWPEQTKHVPQDRTRAHRREFAQASMPSSTFYGSRHPRARCAPQPRR